MKLADTRSDNVSRLYTIVRDAALYDATQRLMGMLSGTSEVARVDSRPVSSDNAEREALAQPGRAPAF